MSPPIPAMVSSNCTYPDPENPSDDLTTNNQIIIGTDNDTDDDDNDIYNYYQPLPMNDMNHISDNDDDDEIEVASGIQYIDDEDNSTSLPPITPIENTLVGQVWAGPLPTDIEMDKNKVDQVKEAMSNFTLPPSSIPDWANNIPEEQWKEQLMDRLKNRTTTND